MCQEEASESWTMKPCKEQGEMPPKDEEYKERKKEPRIFLTTPAQLSDYVFPNPPIVHEVGQLLQDLQ